ncbi:MAG: hypothetical protein FWD36_01910 [Treponema sp.]|nr:hypothetical protein [Treponema sp.]
MKQLLTTFVFCLAGLSLGTAAFAQPAAVNQIAPGAIEQFTALLDNPTLVRPPAVTPLGRNWFRLDTDTHVFTDKVSAQQVLAAITDLEGHEKNFDGKRSKQSAKEVSRNGNELIVDFVMISIVPVVNIRIRSPYRASVTVKENTGSHFFLEIKQLASNSESNNDIKNLLALRYAEEIVINGTTYTYIRVATVNDANASILPGARGALERNSIPANIEALQMIIAVAKNK